MPRPKPVPLLELAVEDVLRRWPHGALALRRAGLGACLGCAMAPHETLAEAARSLGLQASQVSAVLSRELRRGKR